MFWRVLRALMVLAAVALAGGANARDEWLSAPNPGAPAVNQLAISTNACGPAAVLNAFALGNPPFQRAFASLDGSNDRERLSDLIRRYGLRPSVSLKDRQRWQAGAGVNLEDLAAMANDLARRQWLPLLSAQVYVPGKDVEARAELRRVHRDLTASMRNGLPPVVSLRRQVRRAGTDGQMVWTLVHGHYVVITGVPRKLPGDAMAFTVTYLDPWGGRSGRGEIRLPEANAGGLGLVADFATAAGANRVRKGEVSVLSINGAVGRF